MSAPDLRLPREPLLECPASGLPAEITDRFTLDGAPTPAEHVKLVCVVGHWYTPPADQLPARLPVPDSGLDPDNRAPASRRRSTPNRSGYWLTGAVIRTPSLRVDPLYSY